MSQGLKKDFEEAGFKIQLKQLTDFEDAYGLEGEEDDEEIEGSEGSNDDDDESGSDEEMED